VINYFLYLSIGNAEVTENEFATYWVGVKYLVVFVMSSCSSVRYFVCSTSSCMCRWNSFNVETNAFKQLSFFIKNTNGTYNRNHCEQVTLHWKFIQL